jgi:hypothetical protein
MRNAFSILNPSNADINDHTPTLHDAKGRGMNRKSQV